VIELSYHWKRPTFSSRDLANREISGLDKEAKNFKIKVKIVNTDNGLLFFFPFNYACSKYFLLSKGMMTDNKVILWKCDILVVIHKVSKK
jgi:hypothetical protein